MTGPLSPCPQPQGRGAGQPQGFPHEHLHPPRHRRLHAGAGGAPAHGPAGLAPRGERRWSRRYGAGVRSPAGQEAARSGAALLGGFACPLPREAASSWGWRRCGSASPLLPCLCQKHPDCQLRGWLLQKIGHGGDLGLRKGRAQPGELPLRCHRSHSVCGAVVTPSLCHLPGARSSVLGGGREPLHLGAGATPVQALNFSEDGGEGLAVGSVRPFHPACPGGAVLLPEVLPSSAHPQPARVL